MRKLLSTAAVATAMFFGAASAHAGQSQAYTDAANTLASSSNGNLLADWADNRSGSELAGLISARDKGVTGLQPAITALADDIVANYGYLPDLPNPGNYGYSTDQVYGLARAGGSYTAEASAYFNFYSANYGGDVANAQFYYTNAASETAGVYYVSHLVLAANIAGTSGQLANYQGELATELATLIANAATLDSNTRSANGEVSTTEALAIALWALKTSGSNAGDAYLATLVSRLTDSNTSVYENLTADGAKGYTEDMAYTILALEAYGYTPSVVEALKASLEGAIYTGGGFPGQVPESLSISGSNAQYSAAALQALPEPTTLTLVGLVGMGLMSRRRRLAV